MTIEEFIETLIQEVKQLRQRMTPEHRENLSARKRFHNPRSRTDCLFGILTGFHGSVEADELVPKTFATSINGKNDLPDFVSFDTHTFERINRESEGWKRLKSQGRCLGVAAIEKYMIMVSGKYHEELFSWLLRETEGMLDFRAAIEYCNSNAKAIYKEIYSLSGAV